MVCKHCGAICEDTTRFCQKCGAALFDQAPPEEQPWRSGSYTEVKRNYRTELQFRANGRGTKWLQFITLWSPWFAILSMLSSLISLARDLRTLGDVLPALVLPCLAYDGFGILWALFVIVMCILILVEARKLSGLLYRALRILFFGNIIGNVAVIILCYALVGALGAEGISDTTNLFTRQTVQAVGSMVVSMVNLVYIGKRETIFRDFGSRQASASAVVDDAH